MNSVEAEQIMEDYVGSIPITDDITPRDEMVEQFADFDEVGYNIYHVLTALADENSKPEEILLGEVVPKLMTGEITGAEGVALIQEELAKSTNK